MSPWISACLAAFIGAAAPVRSQVVTITSLSPNSAVAGGPGFTLTVGGGVFPPDTVVRWNGSDRATAFVSPSQVTAAIGAADIASPGTAAVTVFTPGIGGGTSNPLAFTIAPVGTPPPPPGPGPGPAPASGAPRAFPNPVKNGASSITFDRFPPGSEIRIITVKGELIKILQAPDGAATWDLANGAGERVLTGLYLYLVPGGKIRGKIAVIR